MARYRTIVADPPWEYRDPFGGFNSGSKVSSRRPLPYAAMSVQEIEGLPVCELASHKGANVFLWATNRYLPAAFGVLARWGVRYSQTLIWQKTGANPFTGSIAPTSCEFLLYGRIGSVPLTGRFPDAVTTTKRLGASHSRKPDVFLDLIEQASPGPYVELFARRARFGWDYWGDQSLGTAEMDAA